MNADWCEIGIVLLMLSHLHPAGLVAFAVAHKPVCEVAAKLAPPLIKLEAQRIQRQRQKKARQ